MTTRRHKTKDEESVYHDAQAIVTENWTTGYTKKTIGDFYNLVQENFNKSFKDRLDRTAAQRVLSEFIESKNENEYSESPLPLPQIYTRIKRAAPTIDQAFLKNGRMVSDWVEDANDYWFNNEITRSTLAIGSLLFSAAAFGGLNTLPRLDALYLAIVEGRQPRRVGSRLIMPLVVNSNNYGNLPELDGKQKLLISSSYNFVFDDMTLAWFWALSFKFSFVEGEKPRGARYYLGIFFKELGGWQNINGRQVNKLETDHFQHNLKKLLAYAPYIWALDRCKSIPFWGIQIAQDTTRSCSQKALEWDAHCLPDPPLATVPDLSQLNTSPPQESKSRETQDRHLTRDLISALQTALKKSNKKSVLPLEELLTEPWHENEQVLIKHFKHQRETTELKPSSLKRYLDYIGHSWLLYSDEIILSDADDEEYLEVYQQCLSSASSVGRSETRAQLSKFHNFLVQTVGAPPIELEAKNSVSICRSAILPVAIYRWILRSILNADGEQTHIRKTLALLMIIGYRCGLRAGEFCNIRMNDLFVVRDEHLSHSRIIAIQVQVRRKLKSGYAFRRLLMSDLMAPDERQIFFDYYRKRINETDFQSSAPLFTLMSGGTPIASDVPNTVLQNMLDQYPHPLPHYVFHSLRHTAFSNWMLLFFGDPDQVRLFTDYEAFADDVRRALVGDVVNPQEPLHAIAQVAGHATPGQTIESYSHWTHEIIGWKLSKVNHVVPLSYYTNVCGWSTKQIRNRLSGERIKSEAIESSSLREPIATSLVKKETCPSWIQTDFKLSDSATSAQASGNDFDPATFGLPGMSSNPFSFLEVESQLQKVASGQHVDDLIFDPNQRKLLRSYVSRAQDVYSRVSRTGTLRLVNEVPGANGIDQRLSPQALTSKPEKAQVNRVLETAYGLFKDDEWRGRLRRQIDVFLDRATATKSHVSFSKLECINTSAKREGALYQWLITMEKLFSDREIRITGRTPSLCAEKLEQLGLHESKKIVVDQRSFNSLAGFQVSIVMPGEKKKLKQAKQRIESSGDKFQSAHAPQKVLSSWVLKYVFPMLYITWPDGD